MSLSTPPLLPSGLMDVLPPLAAAEFRLIHHFLKTFMAFDYAPVIPPLAEYAASLLAGQGEATSHHVFRLNDPLAPQQLGIRADITGQVARIASHALAAAPRPLRLCYAGYTLRTAPEALKTRRQHTQVGIERFGPASANATAEVLAIATHALAVCGVEGVTIDLHYPSAMEALLVAQPPHTHARIRDAVRMKDVAELRRLGAADAAAIIECTGDAATSLAALYALALPALAPALAAVEQLVATLRAQQIAATLSLDLLDLSGYGYYTGVGYAIYWNQTRIEAGRGGCYRTERGEEAVGFTLYINELLDHLPAEAPAPRQTIPYGTPTSVAAALHAQGVVTVFGE